MVAVFLVTVLMVVHMSAVQAADVGMAIVPNGDWWTFDTCHVAVSDVQVGHDGGCEWLVVGC